MKKICIKSNCHLAGIEQDITNFLFRNDTGKYRNDCKNCFNDYRAKYWDNHKEEKSEYDALYYLKYREKRIYYQKEYRSNEDNVKKINKRNNKREKERRKNDLFYRLRKNISKMVNFNLTRNESSKAGKSILKYLNYSIIELKKHLEKQFESWMTWKNQGKYNIKKWNDNDQSTWTWQLDHIIPQSDLPYTSMEDENFKKCWALENLRPYSAKLNLLDGVNRIRHKGNQ